MRLSIGEGGCSVRTAVFDGETWTARTVANTKVGTRAGLRHGSVSSLAVGCDGELWIGTGNGWSFWGAGIDVLTPDPTLHALAGDRWEAHGYPQLAGANTTDIAVDCARRQVWVTAEHHVTQGDPQSGTPGGDWVGGGAAVFDLATKRWTRYNAAGGLECYARSFVECEATGAAVGPDGDGGPRVLGLDLGLDAQPRVGGGCLHLVVGHQHASVLRRLPSCTSRAGGSAP